MVAVRKDGKRWRADVKRQNHRKSKTFAKKNDAYLWGIEYEKRLDAVDGEYLPGFTMLDCFRRYAKEESPKKKGQRWETIRLQALERTRLANVVASDLRLSDVQRWIDTSLERVTPATVNRELNVIVSVVKQAVKWKWIPVYPLNGIERPPPTKPRRRRIKQVEIDQIVDELGLDVSNIEITQKRHEVAVIFLLGIETACRLGELCSLRWENVHLKKRYIHLEETKNGDTRDVPLSRFAVRLFESVGPDLHGSVFKVSTSVAGTLFRKYRDKTNIKNLHMHDTRHEGVSRLAKKFTMMELAKIVGHRDPRSLMIYYEPTPEELAEKLD